MFSKKIFPYILIIMVLVTMLLSCTTTTASTSSDEIQGRLEKAIVLYIGSPVSYVNNKMTYIDSTNNEVAPYIKNSRTMVPIRFISESLGADVKWDAAKSTATISYNTKTASLKTGETKIVIDGKEDYLDAPAEITSSRLFVPFRKLVEDILGYKVFYDRNLIIISDNENIFDKVSEKNLIDEVISMISSPKQSDTTINKTEYAMYAGTYSKNGSKGIYSFKMDSSTGQLQSIGSYSDVKDPSYIIPDASGKFLYAVSETDTYQGSYGGAAGAYSIDRQSGELKFLNLQPTEGKSPCHLCVDPLNRFLFTANYNDGSVSMFRLGADGFIGQMVSRDVHQGSGPNKSRQASAHAHYVTFTPDGKYLCSVDLGMDKVLIYDYDADKGSITPASNPYIQINPGYGPRHMEFSPDGKFAYIVSELSSTVSVFSYSPNGPVFTAVQNVSTLPENYSGSNNAGAIHVSPDGNFVYASNRGNNSIAIFKADKITGKLQLVSTQPTLGRTPRDFSIDPTGKYLYAANQDSGIIVPFAIDASTGLLSPIDGVIKVPSPTCIKFVALDSKQ